jgi:DNA-binding response OmpR family regulator
MPKHDPSVLLIEDDESLRHILARHLTNHGYDVEEAASAEGAEHLIAQGTRPDVVLLDINLPGATGWDLLRGRALGRSGSPPVVVCSAVAINPRRLSELGIVGYLPKPFSIETLMDTIERVLQPEQRQPSR